MKAASTSDTEDISRTCPHLLDTIRAIRGSVGDGLNDDEFTCLVQQTAALTEAGFKFLSYSDAFVTLSVPEQDLIKWYPEKGWISAEKERVARALAEKYRLSLNEPPDANFNCVYPQPDSPNPHHHLELSNRLGTVIVAHPRYLKVRLFVRVSVAQKTQAAQIPLVQDAGLLKDLSALYRP